MEIVFLVLGQAPAEFHAAKVDPRAAPFLEQIAVLSSYNNFTLAGIAGSREPGRYEEIYARVKAALIDDAWATIGSTNIANRARRASGEPIRSIPPLRADVPDVRRHRQDV